MGVGNQQFRPCLLDHKRSQNPGARVHPPKEFAGMALKEKTGKSFRLLF
jgi:hypothetical protein